MIIKLLSTCFLILLSYLYIYYKIISNKLRKKAENFFKNQDINWKPKLRNEIIDDFKNTTFDIIIVGGGSSGVGCAIDATLRGLKVGLIEADDFGSGVSSKCTKLLHGGVRYLEKAFNDIDKSQFKLVLEAINERKIVMDSCPFLSRTIKLVFPVFKRIKLPYYYIGLAIYDWISGINSLGRSKFLSVQDTIDYFPHIKKERLVGSISYFDGQFYDAKLNVLLALTAAYYNATVINHAQLTCIKKENGKIVGITFFDKICEQEIHVKCKVLLNTTGPFTDKIRKLANEDSNPLLQQSYGSHIVVPASFSPKNMGFVDPNTADGRLAFFINYKGKTLIGGTDIKCTTEKFIKPTEEDLNFLIHEANFYTDDSLKLTKKDVLAIWTGIRPLVKDTKKQNTEKIVRKHLIKIEEDNLVTLTGGKWTIYRLMAEQTIDKIVKYFNFKELEKCKTKYLKILGSLNYSKATEQDLSLILKIPEDIGKHLATSYGTKAYLFENIFKGNYSRILDGYPYTKEEVIYCIEYEMAYKLSDILFNRFLISYIDVRKAHQIMKPVCEIMTLKFNWDQQYVQKEIKECLSLLDTCGYSLLK